MSDTHKEIVPLNLTVGREEAMGCSEGESRWTGGVSTDDGRHHQEPQLAGGGWASAVLRARSLVRILQALERLVSEAIHIQIACLQELLQYEIQAAFDILDLRLQKKTLSLSAPPPPLPCITTGPAALEDSPKASKANKGKKGKAKK